MKLEIEISEEDAACIWENNWGEKNGRSIKDIIQKLLAAEALEFRSNFPESVETSIARFREANAKDAPSGIKQNARPPSSGLVFAELLARHRIIQSHAIDDSEDYDGGVTLDRIYAAHSEMISETQEKASRIDATMAFQTVTEHAKTLERELADAAELLAEIMRDEVNHQDEAEKWLRAYAPQHLFPENATSPSTRATEKQYGKNTLQALQSNQSV